MIAIRSVNVQVDLMHNLLLRFRLSVSLVRVLLGLFEFSALSQFDPRLSADSFWNSFVHSPLDLDTHNR